MASDRITVDGAKVGYCYRVTPSRPEDSGWIFVAGDESQDYLDDPTKAGIYALNTIANYDRDIILLLDQPVGSAFERDADGTFVAVPAPPEGD